MKGQTGVNDVIKSRTALLHFLVCACERECFECVMIFSFDFFLRLLGLLALLPLLYAHLGRAILPIEVITADAIPFLFFQKCFIELEFYSLKGGTHCEFAGRY